MDTYKLKECVVMLEPVTPKAQLTLSAELRKVIHERNVLTARTKKKFINALEEIQDVESDNNSAKKSLKEEAICEVLNTEVSYLKQLEIIMNYFMKPIKERKILSDEDFRSVFGDIGTIYEVNGALLEELQADPSQIAEAFSKLAPFFKLYSVYAYNYSNTIKTLQVK